MSAPKRQYFLKTHTLQAVLDRCHLTHTRFARHLGIHRSHWSQLFNARRPVSPDMRQALLTSRYTRDVPEDELWEVRLPEGACN
ncbi:MAG: hypothetical protein EP330_18930 [Deltaproteobacteria bacterium]|nr:MAG: hypothetical protein EP330_18930 [Deltaproteobacteria bacterium]